MTTDYVAIHQREGWYSPWGYSEGGPWGYPPLPPKFDDEYAKYVWFLEESLRQARIANKRARFDDALLAWR